MSIEQNLERIAVALEEIAAQGRTATTAIAAIVKTTKASKPVTTAEKGRPETETSDEVDPFAAPEAEPLVTLEKLSDTLKLHAKALGTKVTIALIKKHGADSTTPKINTIPAANWFVCFAEAEADLKKTKKV